jgi:hypothetical protein
MFPEQTKTPSIDSTGIANELVKYLAMPNYNPDRAAAEETTDRSADKSWL